MTDAWGGRGGIAQYNRDFIAALARSGALASITVLPRSAPDHPAPPAGVRQLSAKSGRLTYSLRSLWRAIATPVDVVFCGHLYMAPLAYVIARLKGAKFVVQTHGVEAWPVPKATQRRALEAADLVLAVSRHTRRAVLGWASILPERLIVLPNTVDDAFGPGDGSALRKNWKLEGKRILLTVGRLDPAEQYKGHDRVIAAVPRLKEMGHDVAYLIVGEGADMPRLKELAESLGVGDAVLFLGAQPDAVKLSAYRTSDLFVMPSTGEGFGIVYLEAMACGLAAVGAPVAGALDALGDGELGTLARLENLSDVIGSILASPPRGELAMQQAVHERFGRPAFERTVFGILERLGGELDGEGERAGAMVQYAMREPAARC